TVKSPSRRPARTPRIRNGVWLQLSMPPASTTSASPARILVAPRPMVVMAEQQARSSVSEGVSAGMPALKLICRAATDVEAASNAEPKIDSVISSGRIPERSSAAMVARPPSSTAEYCFNFPPNFPNGVLIASTIETVCMPVLQSSLQEDSPARHARRSPISRGALATLSKCCRRRRRRDAAPLPYCMFCPGTDHPRRLWSGDLATAVLASADLMPFCHAAQVAWQPL